jgi:hypothetical protein
MTSRSLPTTSALAPRPVLSRSKSHLIPSKCADAPIPPSLLAKAPHLASPHSRFRPPVADPKPPSREDDAWLGDTVPVSHSNKRDTKSTMGPTLVVRRLDGSMR